MTSAFPQFDRLPAELRDMVWEQTLHTENSMHFVQMTHTGHFDMTHRWLVQVEFGTVGTLTRPSASTWPVLWSEDQMGPIGAWETSHRNFLCIPKPDTAESDPSGSNAAAGLPANVAAYSAYHQARLLHKTCKDSRDAAVWWAKTPEQRKQTGDRGDSGDQGDGFCGPSYVGTFPFRNEADVLCLVRRPGHKYHGFHETRVGPDRPFAQIFPRFGGAQRVAFEWGPQAEYACFCGDCDVLRRMEAEFPSWRDKRQAEGGNGNDAAQDRDLIDQFLEAVAARELPAVKIDPYQSVQVLPADADRDAYSRPGRAEDREVFRVSRHDFDAAMRPVCSAHHGARLARWFQSDLVAPLGLHHFPALREMYMIDWTIRPRAGAQVPADRQCFSAFRGRFVHVDLVRDPGCWDVAPPHADGGDVFKFVQFVQTAWSRGMCDFLHQFRRWATDPEEQNAPDEDVEAIRAADAVSDDPWRWRVDGHDKVWRWHGRGEEKLSQAEIERLDELLERGCPRVMVLAFIRDDE